MGWNRFGESLSGVRLGVAVAALLAVGGACPAGAAGAERYVAKAGSDGSGDGSKGSPWKTVGHALSQVAGGDTLVLVGAGVPGTVDFEENVVVPAGLEALQIVGQKMSGQRPTWASPSAQEPMVRVEAAGVRIEGIHLVGQAGTAVVQFDASGGGGSVVSCEVESGGPGVAALDATGIVVEGCELHGQSKNAVYFQAASGSRVSNSTFSSDMVVVAVSGGVGVAVVGNTIAGGTVGISLENVSYSVISANEVSESLVAGIRLTGAGDNLVVGNHVEGSFGDGGKIESAGNAVVGNRLTGNDGKGLVLTAAAAGCELFLNDLSANKGGALSSAGSNLWSPLAPVAWKYGGKVFSGKPGNHYGAVYGGADDGSAGVAGDGLGDTQIPVVTDSAGDSGPLVASLDAFQWSVLFLGADGTMARMPGTAANGLIQLAGGQHADLVATEPVDVPLVFPALPGTCPTWSGKLGYAMKVQQADAYRVDLGYADSDGTVHIAADAPHAFADGSAMVQPLAFSCSTLVVLPGTFLAARITNQTGKLVAIRPLTSYLAPPGPGATWYPEGGGIAPGQYEVTPAEIALGEVLIGKASAGSTKIKNVSDQAVTFSAFSVMGPDADEVTVDETGCLESGLPRALQGGEECVVSITLLAPQGGDRKALLLVESDDASAPVLPIAISAHAGPQYTLDVVVEPAGCGTVSGNGVQCPADCTVVLDVGTLLELQVEPAAGCAFDGWLGCDSTAAGACQKTLTADAVVTAELHVMVPQLKVEPTALEFQPLNIGETSDPLVVKVSNAGEGLLAVGSALVEGADAASFAVTSDGCGGDALAQGSECSIGVAFAPGAAGALTAKLRIPSQTAGIADGIVTLSGQGIANPVTLKVQVLPEQGGTVSGDGIDCPGDCEETYSTPRVVELDADVTGAWHVAGWLGCAEGEGTTCTVDLQTDATVVALLRDDDSQLDVSPLKLEFEASAETGAADARSISMTNVGPAGLTVTATSVEGADAGLFAAECGACEGVTLGSGESCACSVGFSTDGPGYYWALLAVDSTDALVPRRWVGMKGYRHAAEPLTPPKLALSAKFFNFHESPVMVAKPPEKLTLTNEGGGFLRIGYLAITGEAPDSFAVVSDECSNRKLEGGQSCEASVVFTPQAPGELRATLEIPYMDTIVRGTGLPLQGSAPEPEKEEEAGGDGGSSGGCSVNGDGGSGLAGSLGPGSLAALGWVVLAALWFARRKAGHGRPTATVAARLPERRTRSRGPVAAAVALTACAALTLSCKTERQAVEGCLGSGRLTATGKLSMLNDILHPELTVGRFDCGPATFTYNQEADVVLAGIFDVYWLYMDLEPPYFEGRYYGEGTAFKLFYTTAGDFVPFDFPVTVVDGGIRVVDVKLAYGVPEPCKYSVTLEYDASVRVDGMGGGQTDPAAKAGGNAMLKGRVSYTWLQGLGEHLEVQPNDQVWSWDCWAPNIEPGGWLGGDPPASDFTPADIDKAPVDYLGTEDNEIHVTNERVLEGSSLSEEVPDVNLIEVLPRPWEPGNPFCGQALDAAANYSCPDETFYLPFSTSGGTQMLDRFGVRPVLDIALDGLEAWREDLFIDAPQAGSEHGAWDEIEVEWKPLAGDPGTVTLRGYGPPLTPGGTLPLVFEKELEDSGSAVVHPAMWGSQGGKVELEVSRTYVVPVGTRSTVPVAPESTLTLTRGNRISLTLADPEAPEFEDPSEVESGWTQPVELGLYRSDLEWAAADMASGPGDFVWVSFMQGPGDGGPFAATVRQLDAATGAWSGNLASSLGGITHGPVNLFPAPDGVALTAYHAVMSQGLYPEVWLLTAAGAVAGGGSPGGVEPREKSWPYSALVLGPDQWVAAWPEADGSVWMTLNAGPFQQFPELGSVQGKDAPLLSMPGGGMAVLTYQAEATGLAVGDPFNSGFAAPVPVGGWLADHGCMPVTSAWGFEDLAWFCGPGQEPVAAPYVARMPLSDPAGPVTWSHAPEAVGKYVLESGQWPEAARGGDDSLWLLYSLPCPWGQCAALVRGRADGSWFGPLVPRHVTGPKALAVDRFGRPHVLYAGPAEAGSPGLAPLLHTTTEVVP